MNKGDTVRFAVRNDGKVMHEMVIGTMNELKEHAELMRKFPDMEHDEPCMAHVYYACLLPGHMEAGMIAKITVK